MPLEPLGPAVRIDYTNWRGERATRTIRPIRLYFGTSPHHRPDPEYLLDAHDVEKNALRTYSMKNIHRWEALPDKEG